MSKPQTRSQQLMEKALELVRSVAPKSEQEKEDQFHKEVRRIYGSRCHDLPVMVRTCGLCQTVAFYLDKAKSDNKAMAQAHQYLLQHIGEVLGIKTEGTGGENDPLLEALTSADVHQYILHTRRVLQAWVYFKRFAASILEVPTGGLIEQ